MLYPLLICGVCVVSSVIGTFFVRLGASQNIMGALYKGLIATGVISIVLIAVLTHLVFGFDAVFTGTDVSVTGGQPVLVRGHRPRGDRPAGVDHRVLHLAPTIARCAASPRPRPPATAPTSSRASRSRWKRPPCR